MKYGMIDRIRFLWGCTKGSRLSLFIIYIFSLVDSFSDTVRNIVFALAVSALVGGKSFNEVLKVYGIQTIIVLLFASISMIYYKFLCKRESVMKVQLQQRIMSVVLKTPIDFSENHDAGTVHQNIDSVINIIFDIFVNAIPTILYNVTNIIISVVILTKIHIVLGLIVICIVPLFVLIQNILGRSLNNLIVERNKTFKALLSTVSNTFNMAPFAKSHGNADNIIADVVNKFKADADNKSKVFGEVNTLHELMNIVVIISRTIIDIGGAYLVSLGRISIGTFTLIHSYAKDTVKSINGILKEFARNTRTMNTLDMVIEMLEIPYEANGSIDMEYINTIALDNVSFSYGRENILNNVSCKLIKGKKYAFVGYSGCGKSTILSLVNGLRKVSSGVIRVNNVDMDYVNQTIYRQRIGVVSQNGLVFNGSIRDNITYGCTNVTDDDVWEAIDKANLKEFIQSLPDNIDTIIGENGMKLSGGQRQRITIARAFIRKPQLIIFDEATSALDNKAESEVQKAIDNIGNDVMVLIVAHRLSTIKNVDTIFYIDKGNIVEQGTYDELINKGGYFSNLAKKKRR